MGARERYAHRAMTDPKHDARWDAVEEAAELLHEGSRDAAFDALAEILERDPENEYALYFQGAAYFERGSFEDARESYQRAVKLREGYLGAWVGLGHSLRMLGRNEEALRAAKEALTRTNGQDGDAHYLAGLTFSALGQPRNAIRHLQAFCELKPELEAKRDAEALIEVLEGKAKTVEAVN